MESMQVIKLKERENQLEHWLSASLGLNSFILQPLAGDASFRRYFRVQVDKYSFVVMDAPPGEDCHPFIAVAKALRKMQLNTPEIIEADLTQGFLLLTDFGDLTYLRALNADNADLYYQRALKALSVLQTCTQVPGHIVPPFTREWMWREWHWHQEWFLEKLLGLPPAPDSLEEVYSLLVESAATQPQVFMHRDYHSANLMVLPDAVGLLDFQDAFIGPLTYDLASLLRDCYIDWPKEKVNQWLLDYWRMNQALAIEKEDLLRCFDWMSVQRHLKALFTFARKQVRDQQAHYLRHVPRTLSYILQVTSEYPELASLHQYYRDKVIPACTR